MKVKLLMQAPPTDPHEKFEHHPGGKKKGKTKKGVRSPAAATAAFPALLPAVLCGRSGL